MKRTVHLQIADGLSSSAGFMGTLSYLAPEFLMGFVFSALHLSVIIFLSLGQFFTACPRSLIFVRETGDFQKLRFIFR